MQSPRHPWTIWVWWCPWSTLFSQVFDLFSHTSGTGKKNSPFSPFCLLFIAPQPCSFFKCLLGSQCLKITSAVYSHEAPVVEAAPCFTPLPDLQVHEIWDQLQYYVLAIKRQWLVTKCVTSLPSMLLTAILHCWKNSYADFFQSDHLCFSFIQSTKIKYYVYTLSDVAPFQLSLFRYSGVLIGAKYCLSLPPAIDKQVSQEPDPSAASNESAKRLERTLMILESWCPNQPPGQTPLKLYPPWQARKNTGYGGIFTCQALLLSVQSDSNSYVTLLCHLLLPINILFSIGGSNSYLHWKVSKLENDTESDNLNSYDKTCMSSCFTFNGPPLRLW